MPLVINLQFHICAKHSVNHSLSYVFSKCLTNVQYFFFFSQSWSLVSVVPTKRKPCWGLHIYSLSPFELEWCYKYSILLRLLLSLYWGTKAIFFQSSGANAIFKHILSMFKCFSITRVLKHRFCKTSSVSHLFSFTSHLFC